MDRDFLPAVIFKNLSAKKTDLVVLVLSSQSIKSVAIKNNHGYKIMVDQKDIVRAKEVVSIYFKENKKSKKSHQIDPLPISSFYSIPVLCTMGLLCLIHGLIEYYHIHEQVILSYGSSALFILQGQTFRAVTALFLHADLQHLLGNLAGLVIFAAPVVSISGFGTGLFMLLLSGTSGNLLNAYLYKTAHLSIGASTAVMGAAGLLAAYQATRKNNPNRMNSLMPVCAGAVLVAMFSHGEQTDVWAHVFGFLSGLVSGIVFFPVNRNLKLAYKNRFCLLYTAAIILTALVCGRI